MNHESPVLVTGATGFVGRHLCRHLLQKGYRVRGTYRGDVPPIPMDDMQWCKVEDIGPETDWTEALRGIQSIIHLAGLAHQVGADDRRLRDTYFRVNLEGTRHLAEIASASPLVKRFVYVSTSAVVATVSDRPLDAFSPCSPESAYAESKLAAELALQECLANASMEGVILRPCLIYGPGHTGNLARLQQVLRLGLPIPLGGLLNRRSLLFVENFAGALEASLRAPEAVGSPMLVADPESLSTSDLIRKMGKAMGKPVRLLTCPIIPLRCLATAGDLVKRLSGIAPGLDTKSLRSLLGSLDVDPRAAMDRLRWNPQFTLEAGFGVTFGHSVDPHPSDPTP